MSKGVLMTRAEAHEELHRFAHASDDDSAWAVAYVLDEVTRLRQLLRDVIDFDMGDPPEPDALCAVEGPQQLERMGRAWAAAVAEVGPRNFRRYNGDEP